MFEIANSLSNSINKVTIYRALDAFENKGLIHQVPDIKNIKRYSLCNLDGCNTNSHYNSHGHFICYSCNQTFCLESISASNENLFKGFHVKEINLIAEGFCKNCYNNQYSSHL